MTNLAEFKLAMADLNIEKINIISDFSTDEMLEVKRPIEIDGNGHSITYTGDRGEDLVDYVLQVYRAIDVVITDLELIGGEAGLYVNQSYVTIEGVTTTENELGGIEVSEGVDSIREPILYVVGENPYNNSNEDMPAIWIDGKDSNDGWVDVSGSTYSYRTEIGTRPEKTQLWFFIED